MNQWTKVIVTVAIASSAFCQPVVAEPNLKGVWVREVGLEHTFSVMEKTPYAQFSERQITGSDGCNIFSLLVEFNGTTIKPSGVGPLQTLIACPETDDTLIGLLSNARSYRREPQFMILFDERGFEILKLVPRLN